MYPAVDRAVAAAALCLPRRQQLKAVAIVLTNDEICCTTIIPL